MSQDATSQVFWAAETYLGDKPRRMEFIEPNRLLTHGRHLLKDCGETMLPQRSAWFLDHPLVNKDKDPHLPQKRSSNILTRLHKSRNIIYTYLYIISQCISSYSNYLRSILSLELLFQPVGLTSSVCSFFFRGVLSHHRRSGWLSRELHLWAAGSCWSSAVGHDLGWFLGWDGGIPLVQGKS